LAARCSTSTAAATGSMWARRCCGAGGRRSSSTSATSSGFRVTSSRRSRPRTKGPASGRAAGVTSIAHGRTSCVTGACRRRPSCGATTRRSRGVASSLLGGCWAPACGGSSVPIASGGRAIGDPVVQRCSPPALACRAAGRSSRCRCGRAIATPAAGASSVSTSAAAGSSRPAETLGWRCGCECARPAAVASASPSPSAGLHRRHHPAAAEPAA
jgi:hypothetical protein